MRHSNWMNAAIFLPAVLLFGFSGAGCDTRHAAPPPRPAPEVATVTVQPQPIELTVELPGRTSACRMAEIRPQVNGLIQKRLFTEGADVKAGDVLYRIDPAPFQAALDNATAARMRAEANLPAARARAARYRDLLAENAVSQQDENDAAAALKQVEADEQYWKASVKTAQIQLAYTQIAAPISGRIGRSGVTEGAIVTAYQPTALATIQQLDPIYVDIPQSTAQLLQWQEHVDDGRLDEKNAHQKQVQLLLENGNAYPHEGILQFRDVTVDPTTGSVILRVVVPNPEGTLLPGMFVRAVMQEGVNSKAILIPQQSVLRDPKGNPVALIVDAENKVQQRMLSLDRAIDDQWLVSSGLAQGDQVIVEGVQKVRPGASVTAVPFENPISRNGSTPESQGNGGA
jgi:membrane fusion protein, multidrug efflux system